MPKVLYEKRGHIAHMTLNRPEVLNAMDPEAGALRAKYMAAFRDDPDCRVMIVTGAGEKAFSTGMDLKARASADSQGESIALSAGKTPIWNAVGAREVWKPIIAAINGYCLAGGLEMALTCDIRIAAEHSRFGMPEVTRGFTPGPALVLLPRCVPLGEALYLLTTGDTIDAREALRIGLVHSVVPMDRLMPAATAVAEKICSNGPLAVQAVKQSVLVGLDLPVHRASDFAQCLFDRVFETEDAKEGPRAFAEGRAPRYQGR